MEDLNAQQIVLLTLLVSFVTSIATGIVTVSLLEQAPEPVTQTINRVVEKTVERIITEPVPGEPQRIVEREVVTVVVNEEDLTVEAVDKNSRSLVRIYSVVGETRTFIALGFVVHRNGKVVTDSSRVAPNTNYVGIYSGGEFPLKIESNETPKPFIILSINANEQNPNPENFIPATLANSDNLKLGQSIISLSGEQRNTVSTGIINELQKEEDKLSNIKASINQNNILTGSIILNLKGEVAGMRLSINANEPTVFIPSNLIREFLLSGDLALGQSSVGE